MAVDRSYSASESQALEAEETICEEQMRVVIERGRAEYASGEVVCGTPSALIEIERRRSRYCR